MRTQIQGSKNQAEEGTLIILAAGERTLFEECQTCFEAMGKNSFYLGDVGNASKMNLVLQMMAGVTMATLAEGLSLGTSHRPQIKLLLLYLNCLKANRLIDGIMHFEFQQVKLVCNKKMSWRFSS